MGSISRRPVFLACVLVLAAFGALGQAHAARQAARLPGARPVVEAVRYVSLQEAIDALPASGGVLRIPPGTFEIEQPLVVHQQDLLVRGCGAATHVRNVNTDGEPAIVIKPEPREDGREPEPQWRIQLSDLRVTGNEDSGAGIVAVRVNEVFLDGVTVTHHGGDGIRLDHCYEDPRVSGCLITYNKGTGLNLLGCHDIVVSANQFEENRDALRCIDGFNLCMTGNNLDDHLRHGVVIENTYGSVVSGNMIEECRGTAIVLDRDCYGDALSANVIAHNGGGIDLRDAHGCAVSANTFTIVKADALRIGPGSGRITVTGNNFSDSYIGGGSVKRREGDRAAAGMTLQGTAHLTVSGNLFSGLSTKAVELKGDPARGVLFADNLVLDADSDHGKLLDSAVLDNLEPGGE